MKNKTLLWLRLVLLILIFILISGISYSLIFNHGFSGRYLFNISGFNGFREPNLLKSDNFSDIKSINLKSTTYDIYFEEHDSDQIIVEQYISEKEKENILQKESDTLYIEQPNSFGIFNISYGKIIIKVPKDSRLDYNIDSVSGGIHINNQSTKLSVNTVSGSIKIYNPGEELMAKTISGSIKVYEAFKSMRLNTTSGSIKATADEDSEQVYAESISGSVKIALPRERGYIMKYSSSSGSIKDEYRNTKFSESGTANYGDETLKIEASTMSGSIKLTNW